MELRKGKRGRREYGDELLVIFTAILQLTWTVERKPWWSGW